MKFTSFVIACAMIALGGCAVQQPYGMAPQQSFDPYQWHNVPSDTYAPAGQAERTSSASVAYSSAPVYVQPGYYSQAAPAYFAQPYYAPYYAYPALAIGLDFGFGGWYGGHRGSGHGPYRGGRGHR